MPDNDHPIAPVQTGGKFPLVGIWPFLLLFLVLAAGIIAGGSLYVAGRKERARTRAREELTAFADLKAERIVHWRTERLQDGAFFARAPFAAADVARLLATPGNPTLEAEIKEWLTLLKGGERYARVSIFDPQLQPRLAVPAWTNAVDHLSHPHLSGAQWSGHTVLGDIQAGDSDGRLNMDLVVPLFARTSSASEQNSATNTGPIALILLQIDPHQFLFPLLQSWPTPRRTAETLLVRREGREVVFLNQPRFYKGAAMTLRRSVDEPRLPAAMALRGDLSVQAGVDYRGVPVLAVARPIADSDWMVIAKVDEAELYEPLQKELRTVGLAVALLLAVAGLGVVSLWRWRYEQLLRARYIAEHERRILAERFEQLMRHAGDAILLANAQGRIVDANERAAGLFERPQGELQRLSFADLDLLEPGPDLEQRTAKTTCTAAQMTRETTYQLKDGTSLTLEVSSRMVTIGEGRFQLAIIRDITARKRIEDNLRHSESLLLKVQALAKLGTWEWNTRTGALTWSEQMYRIFGRDPKLPPADIQEVPKYFTKEGWARLSAAVDESLIHGTPYSCEVEVVRADKTSVLVIARGEPVFDPAGTVTGLRGMMQDITDRKHAEIALRQSEERLRLFISNAPIAMAMFDLDMRYLALSHRWITDFGLAGKEVIGRSHYEVFPDLPDRWRAAHRRGLAGEVVRMDEDSFERPDGTLHWSRWELRPWHSADEKIGGIIISAEDITDHKTVEAELRHNLELQSQIASIAATVPGTIYSFQLRPDGSLCLPYASPALENVFGVEPASVRDDATPALNLIHADDLGAVQASIMHSAQSLTPWRAEFRVRSKAGEIWVEGRSLPQRNADGSTLWHGFLHDVTARKRQEEQLRILSRAVEQSPVSVVITDPSGAIEYINPRFTELTGYTLEEARGKNPRILKSDQTPTELYQEMWRTVGSGGEWRGEFLNRKKNGELFWEFACISPILDDAGHIMHFLGIKEDITKRKRLEAERTAMEAQLRQQQRLESIGTLAGGVAHEINNPINGIMNYAQLIQDRLTSDSPLKEYTGEILHETQRVAEIVRNLLTFARTERQSHSPARMSDIVEGTMSLVRTVIRHDQIRLTVEVSPDLPKLKCRSQQIQQVIMNLVTNARDALNQRYPGHDPDKILHVTAHLFEKEARRWIRVTVEDHGTGITPEVRARMFDPFFTTKGRDHGTGLGLSISHGIVKEHHGELNVESEPGRYTRMHLVLPVDNGWQLSPSAEQ